MMACAGKSFTEVFVIAAKYWGKNEAEPVCV